MDEDEKKKEENVETDRRSFLKATVVASAAIAVGGIATVTRSLAEAGGETTSTASGFPRFLIKDITSGQAANINTMQVNKPLVYNYPLDNEPNFIMKLGVPVEDGTGPDGDIVSFSDICQHLGCNPGFVAKGGSPPCNASYVATGPVMYCCCHGSIYDMKQDAKVIGGPAPRPVPRVILEVDSGTGDIYAIGMEPPTIYGHNNGSNDVEYDLQGGTPVS